MSMIFESHAHYDDDAFDEDREALLASLSQNGIEYVVNVGASLDSCKKTLELVKQYPFVYGALGIHPSDIKEVGYPDLAWLASQTVTNKKIVAIGEIGLDYYWDKDNREAQIDFFEKQMDMAKALERPIIVHSRDAAKDTYEVMKANDAGAIGGVVHCFSYGKEEAKKYLDMGMHIGLGGVVTFKNAKAAKEVAEYVPLDRLLLETDSPYLTPEPNRGKRNSSLNLTYIAKAIATLKNIDYDTVVSATAENAKRMYRIGTSR